MANTAKGLNPLFRLLDRVVLIRSRPPGKNVQHLVFSANGRGPLDQFRGHNLVLLYNVEAQAWWNAFGDPNSRTKPKKPPAQRITADAEIFDGKKVVDVKVFDGKSRVIARIEK